MKQKLINYLSAGFPALAIRTVEEQRCLGVIRDVGREIGRNVFVWKASQGLQQVFSPEGREHEAWLPFGKLGDGAVVEDSATLGDVARIVSSSLNSVALAGQIARANGGKGPPAVGLVIFTDLHTWVTPGIDPLTERLIKEALLMAPVVGATVLMVGPEFKIPVSWERSLTCMDFDLPKREALAEILGKLEDDYIKDGRKLERLKGVERENALRAASGLTEPEASNAYALAIIEGKPEKKLLVDTVYREKAAAVRRSGLMELIEPDPRGMDAIGGLDVLKKWFGERRECYSERAREYGLPAPRGILLAGSPGTGKSLAAKCAGTVLGAPTLRWDIGSAMAGIVGQSEANTRAALALAEAVAPCVLWIDEINFSVSFAA